MWSASSPPRQATVDLKHCNAIKRQCEKFSYWIIIIVELFFITVSELGCRYLRRLRPRKSIVCSRRRRRQMKCQHTEVTTSALIPR